jgi:tetratricopeptide (TPR) repeat protein
MNDNSDWIQFGIGMVNMRKERYETAENQFKALLIKNPSYGFAYAQLGYLRKRKGKLDEANPFFWKSNTTSPRS